MKEAKGRSPGFSSTSDTQGRDEGTNETQKVVFTRSIFGKDMTG